MSFKSYLCKLKPVGASRHLSPVTSSELRELAGSALSMQHKQQLLPEGFDDSSMVEALKAASQSIVTVSWSLLKLAAAKV
jgi:hypothetical protein